MPASSKSQPARGRQSTRSTPGKVSSSRSRSKSAARSKTPKTKSSPPPLPRSSRSKTPSKRSSSSTAELSARSPLTYSLPPPTTKKGLSIHHPDEARGYASHTPPLDPHDILVACTALYSLYLMQVDVMSAWDSYMTLQTIIPVWLTNFRNYAYLTTSGHIVSIVFALNPKLRSPAFASALFSVLAGLSICFWVVIYSPDRHVTHPDALQSTFMDFPSTFWSDVMAHGPLAVLVFPYLKKLPAADVFAPGDAYTVVLWPAVWLVGVWAPYQLCGGDASECLSVLRPPPPLSSSTTTHSFRTQSTLACADRWMRRRSAAFSSSLAAPSGGP
jgi:hypothetical protein